MFKMQISWTSVRQNLFTQLWKFIPVSKNHNKFRIKRSVHARPLNESALIPIIQNKEGKEKKR